MEKAYDLKELGKRLEKAGFPILKEGLEETARVVYITIKDWATESAPLSENTIDDFVAPFYGQLDKVVLNLVDDINPTDNA